MNQQMPFGSNNAIKRKYFSCGLTYLIHLK